MVDIKRTSGFGSDLPPDWDSELAEGIMKVVRAFPVPIAALTFVVVSEKGLTAGTIQQVGLTHEVMEKCENEMIDVFEKHYKGFKPA